jgi:hypothetical protein
MPKIYACPSDPDNRAKNQTNYFVVVGPLTVFPGATTTKIDDIARPRDKTILLVEAIGQNISWMEPRDLLFSEVSFSLNDPKFPSPSSKHRHPNVEFVDATREGLHDVSPFDLRTMFLIKPELN